MVRAQGLFPANIVHIFAKLFMNNGMIHANVTCTSNTLPEASMKALKILLEVVHYVRRSRITKLHDCM